MDAPDRARQAQSLDIEDLGGEVRLSGADFDEAKAEAGAFAAAAGLPYFEDGARLSTRATARSPARFSLSRMLLVSEQELAHAVGAYAKAGIRVEGAAAAALAALPQLEDVREPIVLIVTGKNIDAELWARAVEHPGSFPP